MDKIFSFYYNKGLTKISLYFNFEICCKKTKNANFKDYSNQRKKMDIYYKFSNKANHRTLYVSIKLAF